MYGPTWTPEETADALSLGWADFHAAHPARTYHAWRMRRQDANKGRIPVAKAQPVTEGIEQDEDKARALLARSDDELLDALMAYQEAVTAAFPFSQDVRVRLDVDEPIGLCLMSDWHIGSEGCDLRRLRADVALIASHPRLYCGLGGDVVDNFILQKMASAARSSVATVQVQWRAFRAAIKPLLDTGSLLWVSSGNHDQWTEAAAAIDPILAALGRVPCAHIGEGGYVDLTVGSQTYTIWRKHRPSRFRSSFNVHHYLKQMMRVELPRDYDIGISEHIHTPETAIWHYRRLPRVLCALGSYKVRDRWGENWGFLSGGYGVPCVVLYPRTRRLVPFDNIGDALSYMDGDGVPVAAAEGKGA